MAENAEEAAQVDDNEINMGGRLYIPDLEESSKPRLKMVFNSEDAAYDMYNRYALLAGFSIRRGSTKFNQLGEKTRRDFVCYKRGQSRPFVGERKRKRGSSLTNCNARVSIWRSPSSAQYELITFIEGHNHELTHPDKVHLLNSHRSSNNVKTLIEQLSEVNVPTHQQITLLEVQAGGSANVGCTPKDIYNIKTAMRQMIDGHDAELLKEHFEAEKKKNEAFYYKMEQDAEGVMGNVFWCDARSRRAYDYFGDVLVFDTTFNTNRYRMNFAPILGVNNHKQTIVFGCAFLTDETTESFVWLFEEFKKAIPGEPPKMIITDQDAAIASAIKESFPTTFHRLCIWHILNKFVGPPIGKALADITECLWEVDSKAEYDAKWENVLANHGLENNQWLAGLHSIRNKWVPAYVKHVFSAGMSSSQRAESAHAFFKRYITKKNTLMEFIIRFDRAVSKLRSSELRCDHVDLNEKPPERSLLTLMHHQMASIYTRTIFDMFDKEVRRGFMCKVNVIYEDDGKTVYQVTERVRSGVSRCKELVYDKVADMCICSCKGFEFRGVPCRHILAYLTLNQVDNLPEKYILKRWTQTAKIGVVLDAEGNVIKDLVDDGCLLIKRAALARRALDLIDTALMHDGGCKIVSDAFTGIEDELSSLVSLKSSTQEQNRNTYGSSSGLKDPRIANPKGRTKQTKSSLTRKRTRRRRCIGCNKLGHDVQTCRDVPVR